MEKLVGTEKQVEFANDVRGRIVAAFQRGMREVENAETLACCEAALALIGSVTNAKFFLDNNPEKVTPMMRLLKLIDRSMSADDRDYAEMVYNNGRRLIRCGEA
jgi:hypothetical protein